MVQRLLWLTLAGAAGTLSRYALSAVIQRWLNHGFPWGTFVANILGCFIFGIIWTMASERQMLSSEFRIIFLVGFLGAFTSFSSFIFETGQMLRTTQWLFIGLNIFGQILLGTIGLFLGFALGRMI